MMNAYPKTKACRNSARIFPLAALALAGLGLSACASAPSETLHGPSGELALGAAAAAPVTTARLAALPLEPRRDFDRLRTARAAAAESPSGLPVEPRDDRLQLASAAVSSDELQAHRGGFVTMDGIQVDFAFQQVSMVNDLQQITSTITLDQMLAGQPGTVTVGGITTSGSGTVNIAGLDGGVTQITHNVLPTTINTVFANTSSGIDASNTVNLVVDIVGIDTVRIGHRVGLKPMNLEIRNALVHALGN